MSNTTGYQIEIVFLRHGATKGNTEKRYIGKTDEVLCPDGISQVRERASKWIGNTTFSYVFSSPMKRCVETAKLISPDKNPVLISDFREIDFGEFEGKNYEELKENPDYIAWVNSGGTIPFPKGEDREAFIRRNVQGFQNMMNRIQKQISEESSSKQLVTESDEENKITCLCSVHGGSIMAILSYLCEGEYFDYQVKNGEGYRCIFTIT